MDKDIRPNNMEDVVMDMVNAIADEVIVLNSEEREGLKELVEMEFNLIIKMISNRMKSVGNWDDLGEDKYDLVGQIGLGVGLSKGKIFSLIKQITEEGE